MNSDQPDLFGEVQRERETLPDAMIADIHGRLETVLADLESADAFPWEADRLEAVRVEKRFRSEVERLGAHGAELWTRFDTAMDRLFALYNEDRDPDPLFD